MRQLNVSRGRLGETVECVQSAQIGHVNNVQCGLFDAMDGNSLSFAREMRVHFIRSFGRLGIDVLLSHEANCSNETYGTSSGSLWTHLGHVGRQR